MTTGDAGIILKAATVKWISDTEVEVTGGCIADLKSLSQETYHLILKDGEWSVDEVTQDWKS